MRNMLKIAQELAHQLRLKIGYVILGLAVGSGALIMGQGCIATGQCATCRACVSRLPILALPILAQVSAVLIGKGRNHLRRRREQTRQLSCSLTPTAGQQGPTST